MLPSLARIHPPAKRRGLFASAGRVIVCLQRIRLKNSVASNRLVIAAATLLAVPI